MQEKSLSLEFHQFIPFRKIFLSIKFYWQIPQIQTALTRVLGTVLIEPYYLRTYQEALGKFDLCKHGAEPLPINELSLKQKEIFSLGY